MLSARALFALGASFGGAVWSLSEDCAASGHCAAPPETDEGSLLQRSKSPRRQELERTADSHDAGKAGNTKARSNLRITIKDGLYYRDGKEVVLIGGNYVVKAQPWWLPVEEVLANAESIAQQFSEMAYVPPPAADGSPREAVPLIRLGAVPEGSMPFGPEIDQDWVDGMERTIEAFATHGVYVVLDMHQDALSTTNGGNGLPYWMATHFQKSTKEAIIASPEHPFELVIPTQIMDVIKLLGVQPPEVRTISNKTETNPWAAYSAGVPDSGDPRHMNVGNVNMRLNNNDIAWSSGTLILSKQVQNYAIKLYDSYRSSADRQAVFMPFVEHIKLLCRTWEKFSNVLAVEPFNEPPIGGLPSIRKLAFIRKKLFRFYTAMMDELDKADPPIHAPLALEDLWGTVPGANPIFGFVLNRKMSFTSQAKLCSWAKRGQLMLSFHYYFGFATLQTLPDQMQLAKDEAARWGPGVPTFLSEFFSNETQEIADTLGYVIDNGTNAVTYWHYVPLEFTGTPGMYKYPDAVSELGPPVAQDEFVINWPSWEVYAPTVADGTFWGAAITGSGGGQDEVFQLIPGPVSGRRSTVSMPGRLMDKGGLMLSPPSSEEVQKTADRLSADAEAEIKRS